MLLLQLECQGFVSEESLAMLLELVVDMENPFGRLKEKLILIYIEMYLPNLKMLFSVVCCHSAARDS